jgi:hypothetical protein
MAVTFTPENSKVVLTFSIAGAYGGTYTAGQFVSFRTTINGAVQTGRGTVYPVGDVDYVFGEFHNAWGASYSTVLSVSAGTSTTVAVQWNFQSTFSNTLFNSPLTQQNQSRSLIIFD